MTSFSSQAKHSRTGDALNTSRALWEANSSEQVRLESAACNLTQLRGLFSSVLHDATMWDVLYTATGKSLEMRRSYTIEANNLSVAWARAFLSLMETSEFAPLTVVIREFNDGEPMELASIRELIDGALGTGQKPPHSCHEVANTIFPQSLWNPDADRQQLYDRYRQIMPRVLKHPGNRYGVYFQRLIAFGYQRGGESDVNQLEHIIQTWQRGTRRRSALHAAIFDPTKDHTHQRQRGFPCLQQVAFAPQPPGGLAVTGFYATQYIFERAYGNYLGLCRLGHFMAQEMGRQLTQVTCVASLAKRGNRTKTSLQGMAEDIRGILGRAQKGR